MAKFAKGLFQPKNPEKYIGKGSIKYRSSWEFTFMRFADSNPAVIKWASESIKIPYKNPFTGKNTIYVPDFFIVYVTKTNTQIAELIEIKPASQTYKEKTGKSQVNKMHWALNQAKWAAANAFCKKQGIHFRIITENDLYK